MMEFLCISDTHGDKSTLYDVLEREKDAKHIFFTGDGISDVEDLEPVFCDRTFYKVAGNCDRLSFEKNMGIENLFGIKIFYTHGHIYSVKQSEIALIAAAKQIGADIVLYGHTHLPKADIVNGIFVVNPGSLKGGGTGLKTYAKITVQNGKIYPKIIEV